MYPSKSLFLAALAAISPLSVSALEPTSVPSSAHCLAISYTTAELRAAANANAHLPVGQLQGYPMPYPLSSLRYAWPDHGHPFSATGYPWAGTGCDTKTLQKFPLLPASVAGRDASGNPKAWDGSQPRVSPLQGGGTQRDYLFLDGRGRFCMVATETPVGAEGWLPCVWE